MEDHTFIIIACAAACLSGLQWLAVLKQDCHINMDGAHGLIGIPLVLWFFYAAYFALSRRHFDVIAIYALIPLLTSCIYGYYMISRTLKHGSTADLPSKFFAVSTSSDGGYIFSKELVKSCIIYSIAYMTFGIWLL